MWICKHQNWQKLTNMHYCSVVQLRLTVCNPMAVACQASLSLTITQSLAKVMPISSVMPSSHLLLWHPLFLLPSIFPSNRDFTNKLAVHIRWPKYWSFRFSSSSFNEYSGFISHKTGFILLSKGCSGVFSSTTVQRHWFFGALPLYSPALTIIYYHWEDHSLDYRDLCQQSDASASQHII